MLLFPRGPLPWIGLGLILLGWGLRGISSGRWLVRTALDRPILILLLATAASLYPSVDLTLSMPKFYGILLSLSVYYATLGQVSSRRRFWFGVGILVAGTFAISLLGLVGTQWNTGKYAMLQAVYRSIPRLIGGVQTSVGVSAGFNPNELGGSLAFLLPLPLALLLRAPLPKGQKAILALSVFLGLAVIALSASRSAVIGLAFGVLVLVIWRWRRAGLTLLGLVGIALIVAFRLDSQAIMDFLLRVDGSSAASGAGSIPGRLEVWERATYMIQDYPFTGIGLNTFSVVLDKLYPSFMEGPGARIPHAHNIYLQTAVDLGLGGFLGFLALWLGAAGIGWKAYRQARAGSRTTADPALCAAIVGILVGFLSYLIFGLTDAITLGAKPTILLWLMLGLVASAWPISNNARSHASIPEHLDAADAAASRAVDLRRSGPRAACLATRLLLLTVRDIFWIVAFLLVLLDYLVVGLGITGIIR